MKEGYELELYVTIRQLGSGGHLEIKERVVVNASGFLEIAGILHKFHELAETMKSAEEVG